MIPWSWGLCLFFTHIRSLLHMSALPDAENTNSSAFRAASYLPQTYRTTLNLSRARWVTVIYPNAKLLNSTYSYRWRSLSSPSTFFLAFWLSLSCIGWMANLNDEIFLRGPKNTLWLETYFHCPAHLNGRRLRSGDKNTVRDNSRLWSSAQYSFHFLCRFRYYSRQRFRDIDNYLKFLPSRQRPSRPKIQYLLKQVSRFTKYPFPGEFTEIPSRFD